MSDHQRIKNFKAFSLIELSIVILIIGILVAGVTQSSRLIRQMALSSARALTQSSPVPSIAGLVSWYEPTSEKSF
ncbi:MAG: prepilin-type N-terminal cleavage/methylation domain-containing protein [Alphaproteobacteria bacterium]